MSELPQYHSHPYADIWLEALRRIGRTHPRGHGEAAVFGDGLLPRDGAVVGLDPVERGAQVTDPRPADLRTVGAV